MRFNEKCQKENPKRKVLQPTPLQTEAEVMPMGKWARVRAGKWCAPGKNEQGADT